LSVYERILSGFQRAVWFRLSTRRLVAKTMIKVEARIVAIMKRLLSSGIEVCGEVVGKLGVELGVEVEVKGELVGEKDGDASGVAVVLEEGCNEGARVGGFDGVEAETVGVADGTVEGVKVEGGAVCTGENSSKTVVAGLAVPSWFISPSSSV